MTFTLGCSCGRAESENPAPQDQKECFSYVVSVDGVHVCYPQDIVDDDTTGEGDPESKPQKVTEYEGTGEDVLENEPHDSIEYECIEENEPENHPQNLVELEDTSKDEFESKPQETIDEQGIEEDDLESNPQDLVKLENTRNDETESKPHNIIEYESTEEKETESNLRNLTKLENTGKDEIDSNPPSRVECDIEAAVPKCECPCSLLERRGKSRSGMLLVLATWTSPTLVAVAGGSLAESEVVDTPRSASGKYECTKLIGMDGEGTIHLMESRSARRFIVRKTVRFAKTVFAKPIEATILQDIFPDRHENIIRLHDFEPYREEGARYYLEYCSGGDLHQLVQQYQDHGSPLPEPFIWQAYRQLASALEFLHQGFDPRCSNPDRRGICHRDIKPSNIFLRFVSGSEYPEVVLADFGHATLEFATYDPAGTTYWQPPELPRHSPKGDVYSLGTVIHFLIHFDAPIAKLPDGAPDNSSTRDAWALTPQARQPRLYFIDIYSEELICVMLIPLEADHNKRKNSSQLLKLLNHCIGQKFPPSCDLRQKAKEWPLATWAFDHVMPLGPEKGQGEEEAGNGMEQYYEMMQLCTSREDFPSSSPGPSDKRRRVAGGSPRALEMSSIPSLSETCYE